jgi:hypothetical protein
LKRLVAALRYNSVPSPTMGLSYIYPNSLSRLFDLESIILSYILIRRESDMALCGDRIPSVEDGFLARIMPVPLHIHYHATALVVRIRCSTKVGRVQLDMIVCFFVLFQGSLCRAVLTMQRHCVTAGRITLKGERAAAKKWPKRWHARTNYCGMQFGGPVDRMHTLT